MPRIMIDEKKISPAYGQFILPGAILLAAILISGTLIFTRGQIAGGNNIAQVGGGTVQPTAEPVDIPVRNGAPVMGANNAKVTIYEFSDFQCPYCERFYSDTFGQIKSQYIDTGKVKFIFRHYPLSFHQNAQKAAEAAECANRQGKFWQYHDTLFENGKSDGTGLNADDLKKYAGQLGLDQSKFNKCLDNNETASVVKQDTDNASASGVTGTPTLFVNGNKIVGALPYETFKAAIENALK